jgi:hypothetical protein
MLIAPIGLWRVGREVVQSIRDTLVRSAATVRAVQDSHSTSGSDWNTTIAFLGVTQARIEREVLRRQIMSVVAALFFFAGLYGIARRAFLPGAGCACLAAIYYLQSVLRLNQIRHNEFTSVGQFFARAKREPIELLPLGLPSGWRLNKGQVRR